MDIPTLNLANDDLIVGTPLYPAPLPPPPLPPPIPFEQNLLARPSRVPDSIAPPPPIVFGAVPQIPVSAVDAGGLVSPRAASTPPRDAAPATPTSPPSTTSTPSAPSAATPPRATTPASPPLVPSSPPQLALPISPRDRLKPSASKTTQQLLFVNLAPEWTASAVRTEPLVVSSAQLRQEIAAFEASEQRAVQASRTTAGSQAVSSLRAQWLDACMRMRQCNWEVPLEEHDGAMAAASAAFESEDFDSFTGAEYEENVKRLCEYARLERRRVASEACFTAAVRKFEKHMPTIDKHPGQLSPAAFPVMVGMIEKQGDERAGLLASSVLGRQWRQRYFELRGNTLYYRKEKEQAPKGAIQLSSVISIVDDTQTTTTSSAASQAAQRGPFMFNIVTPFRVYHFRTATAEERVHWMHAIAAHARITPLELQLRNLDFGDYEPDGRPVSVFPERQTAILHQHIIANVPAWRGVVSVITRSFHADVSSGISELKLKKSDVEHMVLSYSLEDIDAASLKWRVNKSGERINKQPIRCWAKLAIKIILPHQSAIIERIPFALYEATTELPQAHPMAILYAGPEISRYRSQKMRFGTIEMIDDPSNEFIIDNPLYCPQAEHYHRKHVREAGPLQIEVPIKRHTVDAWFSLLHNKFSKYYPPSSTTTTTQAPAK